MRSNHRQTANGLGHIWFSIRCQLSVSVQLFNIICNIMHTPHKHIPHFFLDDRPKTWVCRRLCHIRSLVIQHRHRLAHAPATSISSCKVRIYVFWALSSTYSCICSRQREKSATGGTWHVKKTQLELNLDLILVSPFVSFNRYTDGWVGCFCSLWLCQMSWTSAGSV